MPVEKSQIIAPLDKLQRKDIEVLRRKTVNAIIFITAAYILGITCFVILLRMQPAYCFIAVMFPLAAYLWIVSFGAKHVNNLYGFMKTEKGTFIYNKKRKG